MLAVVHKSVAKAPAELAAPESGSPDARCQGSEILTAYKNFYPDAVAMHFDGDSFMAFTHSKQQLLRPRFDSRPCLILREVIFGACRVF